MKDFGGSDFVANNDLLDVFVGDDRMETFIKGDFVSWEDFDINLSAFHCVEDNALAFVHKSGEELLEEKWGI
jgi:hypothetical protein